MTDQKRAMHPLHVLVVDDVPDDRLLVERELRREFGRIDATHVRDARGLYEAVDAGRYDVAITDYQLQWTDGLFVAKALKARHPDRPVLMFTNSGSEEIAVQALKMGVDDYVLKRKGYRNLAQTVRKVLGWYETRGHRIPRILALARGPELEVITRLARTVNHRAFVVSADTAEEAVRSLSSATRDTYDAMVVDVREPRESYFSTIAAAAALHPLLPIFLVLEPGDPASVVQGYQTGASCVVARPLDDSVFVAWLQRAVYHVGLSRTVARQKEALERYARELERCLSEQRGHGATQDAGS